MKTCKTCNQQKSIEEFYLKKTCVDGLCKECKECHKERKRKWKLANPEKVKAQDKKMWERRKRKVKEYRKRPDVAQRNREKKRENHAQRYRKDVNYRLSILLRSRIRKSVKRKSLSESTQDLLGCDWETVKAHLESQFTQGMSWNNHGEWHIDHIKPCSSFDLKLASERQSCFHYLNLQPLWAIENLKKSNKTTFVLS